MLTHVYKLGERADRQRPFSFLFCTIAASSAPLRLLPRVQGEEGDRQPGQLWLWFLDGSLAVGPGLGAVILLYGVRYKAAGVPGTWWHMALNAETRVAPQSRVHH